MRFIENYKVEKVTEGAVVSFPVVTEKIKINKVNYLVLHSGFDIETTKGSEASYMYHWQFSILGHDKIAIVYCGRTWGSFTYFLDELKKYYKLDRKNRVYVWVHNLSYEWSWLKNILTFDTTIYDDIEDNDYFMTAPRKCLKVIHNNCIEFRDSYSITNSSLEYLCTKIFPHYIDYKKMSGDLDFTITRNSLTPLTSEELIYCYNDVLALSGFSIGIYTEFIKPFRKIPLTQCQIILTHLENEYKITYEHNSNIVKNLKKRMSENLPTKEEYLYYMQYLFRGGWCGSDVEQTNKVIEDMIGADETSAYPYAMLVFKYPMGNFNPCDIEDIREINNYKHTIVDITLYNIKSIASLNYLSKEKCVSSKAMICYNGKIDRAGEVRILATEIDIKLIFECYAIDEYKINSCRYNNNSRHLDIAIINNLLHFYKAKKVKKDNNEPYGYEKALTNINYGAMVKRVRFERTGVDVSKVAYLENSEEVNWKSYCENTLLSPYWGIYVTAYARVEGLFKTALAVKSAYSDTDSIKCKNTADNIAIIEADNIKRYNLVIKALEYYQIEPSDYHYYTDLGHWDIEYSNITRFCTLGAKRYVVEYEKNNEIKVFCKIAGLPLKSLESEAEAEGVDVIEKFLHTKIDILKCKKTTKYLDTIASEEIIDSYGNVETMTSLSSVSLVDIDFNMTVAGSEYRDRIKYFI